MKKPGLEKEDVLLIFLYWSGFFIGKTIFTKNTNSGVCHSPQILNKESIQCHLVAFSCILLQKSLIPFEYRRGKFQNTYLLGTWLQVQKFLKIASFQALLGRFFCSWTSSSPFENLFSLAFFLGSLGFLAETYLLKVGLKLFFIPAWKAVKKKKKQFFVSDNPHIATAGFYAGVSCFFLLCVWYETFQSARRSCVVFRAPFGRGGGKRGARETLREEEED